MFSSNVQKTLIALVLFIGLGFLVYNLFINKRPEILIRLLDPENTETVGEDILILVEKLKVVSIDPSLFSSTLFTNLKDSSAVLTPESQGRSNPFAPVGLDTGSI